MKGYIKNFVSILCYYKSNTPQVQNVQQRLLSMCLQVAKGMAREKLVHRDLAARNLHVS